MGQIGFCLYKCMNLGLFPLKDPTHKHRFVDSPVPVARWGRRRQGGGSDRGNTWNSQVGRDPCFSRSSTPQPMVPLPPLSLSSAAHNQSHPKKGKTLRADGRAQGPDPSCSWSVYKKRRRLLGPSPASLTLPSRCRVLRAAFLQVR